MLLMNTLTKILLRVEMIEFTRHFSEHDERIESVESVFVTTEVVSVQ